MDVNLVMFTGDGARRDFPIGKQRVVIGRTRSCDLRIPLSSVSRKHCEVVVGDEAVKLRDLGSSNGTYRNGVRVQEVELDPGDQIGIGPVAFTLEVDGEPKVIEPVPTVVSAQGSATDATHVDSGNSDELRIAAPKPAPVVNPSPDDVAPPDDQEEDDVITLDTPGLEELGEEASKSG